MFGGYGHDASGGYQLPMVIVTAVLLRDGAPTILRWRCASFAMGIRSRNRVESLVTS